MLRTYVVPDLPVHVECEACLAPIEDAIRRAGLTIDGKIKTNISSKTTKVRVTLPPEISDQEAEKKVRAALDDVDLLRNENDNSDVELESNSAPDTKPIPFYQRKMPRWLQRLLGGIGIIAGLTIMLLMIFVNLPFIAMVIIGAISITLSLTLGAQTIWRAVNHLRHGRVTMDTLIAVGGLAAIGVSITHLFIHSIPMLFDAALFVFGFQYIGESIKEPLREQNKNASFKNRVMPTVRLENVNRHVALDKIAIGSIMHIPRGKIIPIDGIILDDEAMIYETIINGSTMPLLYGQAQAVKSGMRVADKFKGSDAKPYIRIQTTTDYANSYLSKLENDLTTAKKNRTINTFSKKMAKYLVPAILIIAVALFIASFFAPPLLTAAIMVLAAACPCSIGLVEPAATKASIEKAEEKNVLFNSNDAVLAAAEANMILLDFNGTMTTGEPVVTSFINMGKEDSNTLLSYVAALEQHSDHHIGRAIHHYAAERNTQLLVSNNPILSNTGISDVINGKHVVIGNKEMMRGLHIELPTNLAKAGESITYVAVDGKIAGYFILSDPVRHGLITTINTLKNKFGLRVCALTGAAEETVAAYHLPLDDVFANCVDKGAKIAELEQQGHRTIFVGDGINDAVGMRKATLGVAIRSASSDTLTADLAGAVIDSPSLLPLIALVETAKQAASNIKQNLIGSLVGNGLSVGLTIGIGIAVALGVTAVGLSIVLNPGFAAAAMMLLIFAVASNVARFRFGGMPGYEMAVADPHPNPLPKQNTVAITQHLRSGEGATCQSSLIDNTQRAAHQSSLIDNTQRVMDENSNSLIERSHAPSPDLRC